MAIVEYPDGVSYHLDDKLKKGLDKNTIPALHKKDSDWIIALDGAEGSGKSTLALQIARYVDPTFCLDDIVFDNEGFKERVFTKQKGGAIVFDECFTGLSSRASLSKVSKMLVSLMMQMRQKNLFVIMVLPSFFMLEKYTALFRTRSLIHVYENKNRRGYYVGYSKKKKKKLYLKGGKTFSYNVRTNTRGRFYGVFALGKNVEILYRKRKEEALIRTHSEEESSETSKTSIIDKLLVINFLLKKKYVKGMTQEKYLEDANGFIKGIARSQSNFSKKLTKYSVNKDIMSYSI